MGGNAGDGNNITSPRPFADDLEELENYLHKNNIICDNGADGTAAYMANRFEFTNNIVERNNNLFF